MVANQSAGKKLLLIRQMIKGTTVWGAIKKFPINTRQQRTFLCSSLATWPKAFLFYWAMAKSGFLAPHSQLRSIQIKIESFVVVAVEDRLSGVQGYQMFLVLTIWYFFLLRPYNMEQSCFLSVLQLMMPYYISGLRAVGDDGHARHMFHFLCKVQIDHSHGLDKSHFDFRATKVGNVAAAAASSSWIASSSDKSGRFSSS